MRCEFRRILKDPKLVVLIWNDRDMQDSFTHQYEMFAREFSNGYHRTGSTAISQEHIHRFLNYDNYQIDNFQKLNLDSFIGRYLSVTYSLKENNHEYRQAISSLQNLYNADQ